jgi:hypothetical protein
MSSPVTGSDFAIASQSQSLCERLTNLLGLSSKMKLWFDWAFDSSGDSTTSFKAMFLPPPGTILAYYLKAPEATVKAAIENLGRDSTDIADSNKTPFWVLCDGSNDTPDLRGRLIIGGGAGTGLTNRSVDGSIFGSETVTIGQSNIPTKDHYHGFGDFKDPGTVDDDFALLKRTWSGSVTFEASTIIGQSYGGETTRSGGKLGTTNAINVDSTETQTVTPVSIIPPAMSVWYMMRTPRIA